MAVSFLILWGSHTWQSECNADEVKFVEIKRDSNNDEEDKEILRTHPLWSVAVHVLPNMHLRLTAGKS